MKGIWIFALATVLALMAVPLSAQPVVSAKSGTISWVQGKVFLGDDPVEQSLTRFPDIKENVVLRTELGRAEILLTPGVVMHVGENSSLRMITKRLIDTRLEMLTGSAVVSAVEIAKDTNLTMVCKGGTIGLPKAGHYRIDADAGVVRVFSGTANVEANGQRVEVGSGKMLTLGSATAAVEKFDKEDTDSLENWARQRDQLMAMANVSTARSMYNGYGGYGGYGSYSGYGGYGLYGAGMWGWNPYFGMYTYIPGSGRFCDPYYGFCYWSPYTVGRVYYQPPPMYNGGGGFGAGPSYPTMGATSSGYSGTMASSAGSVSASAPAMSSSGSSAASAASSGSVGHGGGGGGGRGH
jgi:hypothetical protein